MIVVEIKFPTKQQAHDFLNWLANSYEVEDLLFDNLNGLAFEVIPSILSAEATYPNEN